MGKKSKEKDVKSDEWASWDDKNYSKDAKFKRCPECNFEVIFDKKKIIEAMCKTPGFNEKIVEDKSEL